MKNLIANGITTCQGGEYDQVTLKGVLKITSQIKCEELNLEGTCTINGDTTADNAKISGICKVLGTVNVEKALDVYGIFKVSGDLQAETIDIDGTLDVSGTLNADNINILMSHGCDIKEVCGQALKLKKGKGSAFLEFIRAKKHEFVAKSIECDDIYLEYSKIETLSGKNIEIGPKCKIKRLQYTDSFTADKTSVIEEIIGP